MGSIKSRNDCTEILHNHPELQDVWSDLGDLEHEMGETWGVSRKVCEVRARETWGVSRKVVR